jgi:glycosyltransferase involved in cell wall biosynthesis
MTKPKIAILRGPLLNPAEMRSYELLRKEFDLTAFTPHETHFDTSSIRIPKESLWCPIAGKVPFERGLRKWQAARDAVTGTTHSFCGLASRLEGFDLYHVMDQPFCFSYEAALAKRRHGGKLVVSQWENIAHHNEEKFMERQIKRTVREQADLFLAMSELSERALLEEGVMPEKIRRMRAGVDTRHFTPGRPDETLRRSLALPKGAFTVLYVGRLARSKGTFTLLEAARRLVERDADFHFLLVGKDEEGVGAWAARSGLAHSIHLAGFVPYAHMPKYYRLADLLVLPSLPEKRQQEQFGYVLAEGMACGIPAAGSDCGAIPEVIGDPSRIFRAGDADSLLETLLRLKRQRAPAQGKRVRERACALYSSKRLAGDLARVYKELL